MRKLLVLALVVLALAPSSAGAATVPSSIVVIGHGDALGYGSDPKHPYRDAPENSWATGTNPAVNSVYSRILAANAAARGHNVNLSRDDWAMDELASLAHRAVAKKPELVLLQLDGDVRCDGQDDSRIADFRSKVDAALATISTGLPETRIFIVSPWGSFSSYAKYLQGLPLEARLKHAGKGPCQMVESPSGRVVASHVAYIKKVVTGYEAQLAAACAKVTRCRYDGGAAQRLNVTAEDITVDQYHLSIQGQARLAAVEWAAMAGFVGKV